MNIRVPSTSRPSPTATSPGSSVRQRSAPPAPIPSSASATDGSPDAAVRTAPSSRSAAPSSSSPGHYSDDDAQFLDLGADYYDSRTNPERKVRQHVRELQALGYTVTLNPAA
jgi:hypothetical protein